MRTTTILTITKCPATVTACPASEASTTVVTSVIDLYTVRLPAGLRHVCCLTLCRRFARHLPHPPPRVRPRDQRAPLQLLLVRPPSQQLPRLAPAESLSTLPLAVQRLLPWLSMFDDEDLGGFHPTDRRFSRLLYFKFLSPNSSISIAVRPLVNKI